MLCFVNYFHHTKFHFFTWCPGNESCPFIFYCHVEKGIQFISCCRQICLVDIALVLFVSFCLVYIKFHLYKTLNHVYLKLTWNYFWSILSGKKTFSLVNLNVICFLCYCSFVKWKWNEFVYNKWMLISLWSCLPMLILQERSLWILSPFLYIRSK